MQIAHANDMSKSTTQTVSNVQQLSNKVGVIDSQIMQTQADVQNLQKVLAIKVEESIQNRTLELKIKLDRQKQFNEELIHAMKKMNSQC